MIAGLALGFLGLLYGYISRTVIFLRRQSKTRYGYGNNKSLQGAVAAHGNFAAYAPMYILLLFFAEFSTPFTSTKATFAFKTLLSISAAIFCTGRVVHFIGLSQKEHQTPPNMKYRVTGMVMTLTNIMFLSVLNIILNLKALI